ncbi:MAG: hypothetical protein WD960_00045 [Gemmatimonadota bacterium]
MRTRIVAVVSILLLGGCGENAPARDLGAERAEMAAAAFQDEEAARVWLHMMEVIAPDGGWERARYLEFDWGVHRGDAEPSVRSHRWDRWEGRARVESETDDGTMVAIFDTEDPEAGRVWIDGSELEGEEATERLRGAHRSHINDSYWLLMPFKWSDPGVHATYVGTEEEDGTQWEVVELRFDDGTGLTPRNMYRGFVNVETGLMDRWHHYSNPESDPSPSEWTDWRMVGPIQLAEYRRSGGEPRLFFPHLRVETEVPEGAFDPPGS